MLESSNEKQEKRSSNWKMFEQLTFPWSWVDHSRKNIERDGGYMKNIMNIGV